MEEKVKDSKDGLLEEQQKVSLFEFRHNLGLLLDTRYNPLGVQLSHIEKEYSFWFGNCQRVTLERLETHEKSWCGLFKNEILLKDRFYLAMKNTVQYVRSNPDKLAEESKELFDFANYKELQQWKQRLALKNTDTETQTGSDHPNFRNVPEEQDPNYSKSIYGMPDTPVTPPQDDDPKTITADFTAGWQEGQHCSGASGPGECTDPDSPDSADSAKTAILEDSAKLHNEFNIQKRVRRLDIKVEKEDYCDVFTPVPVPVEINVKIEPEEPCADGDALENAPIEHMDPSWPPTAPNTLSSQRREYSVSPCSYNYQDGTPKSPQFDEAEGQTFEQRKKVSYYEDVSPSPTKRKSESTSHYDSDFYDYDHGGNAKSQRIHEPQRFEERYLPSYEEMECQSSKASCSRTKETVENTNNSDCDDHATQKNEFPLPTADSKREYYTDEVPPKSTRGSIVTEINMDPNLLKELTELVKGVRSERKLKGSSPKSALNNRWMAFALQDNGLGIYLSDQDGTPFFWSEERWDTVRTPNPNYGRTPLALKLPPNSLVYGEFVEVYHVFGNPRGFSEFNVVDIAALEGDILSCGFGQRRAICKSYLNRTQKQQRRPKIYVGLKPVLPVANIKTWDILRNVSTRNGMFHLNRKKTSLEIAGVGLIQQSPQIPGWHGFQFAMNQRYVLKAPDPSSKPSLEKYVLHEISKIFNDM